MPYAVLDQRLFELHSLLSKAIHIIDSIVYDEYAFERFGDLFETADFHLPLKQTEHQLRDIRIKVTMARNAIRG